jgi:hypothetical protein
VSVGFRCLRHCHFAFSFDRPGSRKITNLMSFPPLLQPAPAYATRLAIVFLVMCSTYKDSPGGLIELHTHPRSSVCIAVGSGNSEGYAQACVYMSP